MFRLQSRNWKNRNDQTDGEYRLDHAVTATQKAILKAFKMDAAYIQKEAGI